MASNTHAQSNGVPEEESALGALLGRLDDMAPTNADDNAAPVRGLRSVPAIDADDSSHDEPGSSIDLSAPAHAHPTALTVVPEPEEASYATPAHAAPEEPVPTLEAEAPEEAKPLKVVEAVEAQPEPAAKGESEEAEEKIDLFADLHIVETPLEELKAAGSDPLRHQDGTTPATSTGAVKADGNPTEEWFHQDAEFAETPDSDFLVEPLDIEDVDPSQLLDEVAESEPVPDIKPSKPTKVVEEDLHHHGVTFSANVADQPWAKGMKIRDHDVVEEKQSFFGRLSLRPFLVASLLFVLLAIAVIQFGDVRSVDDLRSFFDGLRG